VVLFGVPAACEESETVYWQKGVVERCNYRGTVVCATMRIAAGRWTMYAMDRWTRRRLTPNRVIMSRDDSAYMLSFFVATTIDIIRSAAVIRVCSLISWCALPGPKEQQQKLLPYVAAPAPYPDAQSRCVAQVVLLATDASMLVEFQSLCYSSFSFVLKIDHGARVTQQSVAYWKDAHRGVEGSRWCSVNSSRDADGGQRPNPCLLARKRLGLLKVIVVEHGAMRRVSWRGKG
jgi:hypothetical protein